MGTFWSETLLAMISASLGAMAALLIPRRRSGRPRAEPGSRSRPDTTRVAGVDDRARADPTPSRGPDLWPSRLRRCEQAVCRAFRAVDTMSSTPARQAARTVVRRMEAELPDVRALVELGRGLQGQNADPDAVRRVRDQVEEATAGFAALADQLVEVVEHHVEDPDLARLNTKVAALRERFPLLRPLSAVLESSTERPLIGAPV